MSLETLLRGEKKLKFLLSISFKDLLAAQISRLIKLRSLEHSNGRRPLLTSSFWHLIKKRSQLLRVLFHIMDARIDWFKWNRLERPTSISIILRVQTRRSNQSWVEETWIQEECSFEMDHQSAKRKIEVTRIKKEYRKRKQRI